MSESPKPTPTGGMLGKALNKVEDLHPDNLPISRTLQAADIITQETQNIKNTLETAENKLRIDEKSGLATESYWFETLKDQLDNLSPDDELFVMVGDLNNFKKVNDELGHDAGDKLLGLVGAAFRTAFKRNTDYLTRGNDEVEYPNREITTNETARLGGDEFAIFTKNDSTQLGNNRNNPSSEEEFVAQQASRINGTLTNTLTGTVFEKFNISIAIGGVKHSKELDEIPEDVFIRADAKMFEVKYKGKIDKLTGEDIHKLTTIIPYLENLGVRVESWLKKAVFGATSEQ